jgi:glycosyltransferase involved in cell wall biosynthesis
MKVLLQHPIKPNEISGVATFIRNTQELLARSGVEVRTLPTATASPRELKEAIQWADIVHLSSNHARTYARAKMLRKPIVVQYHYPFWGTWKETAADRELDFWGCWRQSLRVYWGHGQGKRLSASYWNYFFGHVGRSAIRVAMCRAANARVTCSEFMRDDTKIPWPVSVIPYGFNFDSVTRWREKPFPKSASFCFMGRMTPEKGLSCLLQAAALLKEEKIPLHLHVIGDGDDLENSKQQAKNLGLDSDVTFHGRQPWDAALAILTDCAVLVIPSDYDEAAGYVVTEAYALKRAVIGSHRGGIPEQVGPGLVFKATDYQALAKQMRSLALDLSYAQALGEKGYAFALNRCGHAGEFVEIYKGLMKSSTP